MPEELYLLVVVKNVENVFDEKEAETSFQVLGMFLDKPIAALMQYMAAENASHGDRIVLFGCDTKKDVAFAEALVVVNGSVN